METFWTKGYEAPAPPSCARHRNSGGQPVQRLRQQARAVRAAVGRYTRSVRRDDRDPARRGHPTERVRHCWLWVIDTDLADPSRRAAWRSTPRSTPPAHRPGDRPDPPTLPNDWNRPCASAREGQRAGEFATDRDLTRMARTLQSTYYGLPGTRRGDAGPGRPARRRRRKHWPPCAERRTPGRPALGCRVCTINQNEGYSCQRGVCARTGHLRDDHE